MRTAKVVSFINYKGGVGKTTSSYHVACSLVGHHNKKVLLIDIDPQTNLTFLCAPVEKWQRIKASNGTIATLYRKWQAKQALESRRFIWRSPIQIFQKTRLDGLDLIPCDIDLLGEDLGSAQVGGTFPNVESLRKNSEVFLRDRNFLKTVVQEVGSDYDFIIIDCPPNLYLMTQNALVASDAYVVTAIPDHLSTIGLSILREKVRKIGELLSAAETFAGRGPNAKPIAELGAVMFVKVRIGGSLVTVTHSAKMEEVRNLVGADKCFTAKTTELIGFSEAAENSVPVWALNTPNALRAAQKGEYQRITLEFLGKFGQS